MQSRTPDIDSIHDESSHDVIECKIIVCPNCKKEVPETIYCLRCGFPIYGMKQLEINKTESYETQTEDSQTISEPTISDSNNQISKLNGNESYICEKKVIPTIKHEIKYPPVEFEKLPMSDDFEVLSVDKEQLLLPEISMTVHDEIVKYIEPVMMQDVEILVDNYSKVEDHPVEDVVNKIQVTFNLPIENEPEGEESKEMHNDYIPEAATQELLKALMNSISLKLWAIDLLTNERIKEDHFLKLYEGYKSRYENCMNQRNRLLEKAQDLEPLEKVLDNARVGIGELEIRKSLGDLRKGEYEAKSPAYNWDIHFYESELTKRIGEISYLENPAKLLPSEEVKKLKDLAKQNYESLSQLEADNKISVSSTEMVRNDLQKDLEFLRKLEGY